MFYEATDEVTKRRQQRGTPIKLFKIDLRENIHHLYAAAKIHTAVRAQSNEELNVTHVQQEDVPLLSQLSTKRHHEKEGIHLQDSYLYLLDEGLEEDVCWH